MAGEKEKALTLLRVGLPRLSLPKGDKPTCRGPLSGMTRPHAYLNPCVVVSVSLKVLPSLYINKMTRIANPHQQGQEGSSVSGIRCYENCLHQGVECYKTSGC